MLAKLSEQVPQMALAEDDEIVQALGADRSDEALGVRIAVRTSRPESGRTSRRSL